jgi:oligoribonuclease
MKHTSGGRIFMEDFYSMKNRLIWMDLEMTGLDSQKDVILEIGAVVTDSNLDIVAEAPTIIINYSPEILAGIDEWSKSHHEASGLLERVRQSPIDCRQAENMMLSFISQHCIKGVSPLCGNSVWQDRLFLIKHMPTLEAFFHYRIIDVSSVKELVGRWYSFLPPYEKAMAHRSLSDIKESIEELKYYRSKVFIHL